MAGPCWAGCCVGAARHGPVHHHRPAQRVLGLARQVAKFRAGHPGRVASERLSVPAGRAASAAGMRRMGGSDVLTEFPSVEDLTGRQREGSSALQAFVSADHVTPHLRIQ